mgnify:CR=1 FL=1
MEVNFFLIRNGSESCKKKNYSGAIYTERLVDIPERYDESVKEKINKLETERERERFLIESNKKKKNICPPLPSPLPFPFRVIVFAQEGKWMQQKKKRNKQVKNSLQKKI